ncbi:Leucine-rich repeat domain-containing protein [Phytophthora infestans]|uniref:Leucine-rich repeat n=1 Tax=Phytophthora infestans TaxID=4787 RepID=A0A833SYZ2_PHYIN|nr:Leucine-rich repeat domain-containing protein [Phytophthora infestans]KAF4132477.1 Leucine-rich repeat [Phytophthora infestans]
MMSPFDRLRELEKKRSHKEHKGQVPVMDAETLRELCLDNDGYETPELNDSLYAHFRGFQRIEGLEAYYNLKALWLESNGLTRIENLEHLVNLRCLYLSKNLIEKVENLHALCELNTLDLSENRIQSLEGLARLPNLLSLNATRNRLTTSADLLELSQCPLLNNIDISHNLIEDPDILNVLKAVPMLKALRITGNPVVSSTRSFRKTYIAALPQLSFLDRPIFPIERASVTAWQSGGVEAEREAKRSFVNQEHEERRRSLQEFRDWQEQVRERRIKELELERAQKLLETVEPKEIDVDLRGFRAITKEEYVAMDATERAKWDIRIEEAQADSQQAKYEVLGNGIARMGSDFWAASAAAQPKGIASDMPVLQAEKGEGIGCYVNGAASNIVSASSGKLPGNGLIEDALKPAVASVEAEDNSDTGMQAVQDISLVETYVHNTEHVGTREVAANSETVRCENEHSTLLVEDEIVQQDIDERSENNDSSDRCTGNADTAADVAASGQLNLPPPPPIEAFLVRHGSIDFEPRETWAQLQQRASAAPCLLRPQSLPSAFEGEDEERACALATDDRDTTASPVRILSRADILCELGKKKMQHGGMHVQDPYRASPYTNVGELD